MMKYRSAFTTLETVIYQLAIKTMSDTDLIAEIDTLVTTQYANHTQYLKQLIYEESAYLANRVLSRTFIPYKDTHTYRRRAFYKAWHRDTDYYLEAQDDILSVSAITWVGTALTASQFRLADETFHPNTRIEIDIDAVTDYPSDFDESVDVTGIFGYHTDPDNMWRDSLDSIQDGGGINASATSITVTDADALGEDGFTRFQTLQYLRIEDEYLQVTAVNTSTNVLTVKRAQLGTSAASHDNDTQIDVLAPDDQIVQATRRLVIQRFNNPGEQRIIQTTPEGSTIQMADETIHLPPERWRLGSVG